MDGVNHLVYYAIELIHFDYLIIISLVPIKGLSNSESAFTATLVIIIIRNTDKVISLTIYSLLLLMVIYHPFLYKYNSFGLFTMYSSKSKFFPIGLNKISLVFSTVR